jgi:hypothetical protein
MKNRRGSDVWVLVAVPFLALSLSGPAQAADHAPVKLEYKFPEGKTLRYRTSWNAFQTVTLMGQEIQSRERKTFTRTQAFGKRRPDSTLPVQLKVESLHVDLRLQGGIDLTFDSKQPDAKLPDPDLAPLVDAYKLESAASYTIVLDKSDKVKVKAIEGTQKLQEMAGKLDAITRDQVRGRFDPDRLKTQFEREHANLPDGPVKPGETWDRTEIVEQGGQALAFRTKYTYAGTETRDKKMLDKLTSKVVEVKCLPPDTNSASPLKITKSKLDVESSEGAIFFDREAGCVVDSRERTRIKGNITSSGAGTDVSSPVNMSLQINTQLQP